MIAIGCATTEEQAFRAGAAHTMEALDEGHSVLLRRHGRGSVGDLCNEMLADVAARDDLEAVVLLHQDTAVETEVEVLALIRAVLAAAPDVALVGAVDDGVQRELAAADATLLAFSPWAARNLRFDPALGGSADASAEDVSLQAREQGRRVLGVPLGLRRRLPGQASWPDRQRELEAMAALRRKWRREPLPGV